MDTPTDLAKLAIEVALAKKKRSERLLSTPMTAQMLSPQFDPVSEIALGNEKHQDRMGLGFFLGDAARPDLFGHIGDDEGFQSMLMMFADSGKGAVIMANSQLGINLGDFLLDGIAREYRWDKYVRSDRPHPQS
jgi:Beta-lactamase.